ncbi:MAG: hypothetical protein PVH84_05075 [Candidatus Aminicenantes bacterium]|jgi:hypothetical protein
MVLPFFYAPGMAHRIMDGAISLERKVKKKAHMGGDPLVNNIAGRLKEYSTKRPRLCRL